MKKPLSLALGILPLGILATGLPGVAQQQGTLGLRLAHTSGRSSTFAWPYGFEERVLAGGSTRDVRARESALEFGEFPIRTVGLDHHSDTPVTSSARAASLPWELDAVYEPGERAPLSANGSLRLASDDDGQSDRDLVRLFLQPRVQLTSDVHAVLRYSELGTHEDDESYLFEAELGAKSRTGGYGTKLMQRLSAGVGWEVNPNALVKFEVGQDWFDLVDGSSFREENSKRTFYGFQLVLSF